MNCRRVRFCLSEYMDGALSQRERQALLSHISECYDCAQRMKELSKVRMELRQLPQVKAPAQLAFALRVIASREIARTREYGSPKNILALWRDRFQLWRDNLMKPLAIPFAGGLASALVLFAMLAPNLTFPVRPADDIPAGWYTVASINSLGPFGLSDDTLILDITVDENGRMVDYAIPANSPVAHNIELRRVIENNLLFTQFTPANFFGKPTAGKLRIAIRRSQVDVRG